MPTFTGVEVTAQADIDFEVFCGTCNAGLCSATRFSRFRNEPQVTVDACERCMENAKDEGRKEAEAEYEQQLWDLREELAEAKSVCQELVQHHKGKDSEL